MPLLILKTSPPSLVPAEATTFSALRIREREHMQQALKAHPEATESELMVLAEEFGEFDGAHRRIDLLCLDANRNLVVVELKRSEDAGHMELQALRYAAMISTMSFERAIAAHAAFLQREGREGDAEQLIREFLDADDEEVVELTDNVRIILISADFSKEVTSTVLWLLKRDVDIKCLKMEPARIAGEVVVNLHQIIPLPAAEDYQIAIREKAQRRERSTSGRDFTRYDIDTTARGQLRGLKKRWFIYELMREAIAKGATIPQIIAALPSRKGSVFLEAAGTLTPREVLDLHPGKQDRRYFCADEEVFHSGGRTYVLTNQWGLSTEPVAKAVTALLPEGALNWRASD